MSNFLSKLGGLFTTTSSPHAVNAATLTANVVTSAAITAGPTAATVWSPRWNQTPPAGSWGTISSPVSPHPEAAALCPSCSLPTATAECLDCGGYKFLPVPVTEMDYHAAWGIPHHLTPGQMKTLEAIQAALPYKLSRNEEADIMNALIAHDQRELLDNSNNLNKMGMFKEWVLPVTVQPQTPAFNPVYVTNTWSVSGTGQSAPAAPAQGTP